MWRDVLIAVWVIKTYPIFNKYNGHNVKRFKKMIIYAQPLIRIMKFDCIIHSVFLSAFAEKNLILMVQLKVLIPVKVVKKNVKWY